MIGHRSRIRRFFVKIVRVWAKWTVALVWIATFDSNFNSETFLNRISPQSAPASALGQQARTHMRRECVGVVDEPPYFSIISTCDSDVAYTLLVAGFRIGQDGAVSPVPGQLIMIHLASHATV